MILTIPIPGFASIVGFAVLGFSGDGIDFAPGAAFEVVQLTLSLLGKLIVGNVFFHMCSSFAFAIILSEKRESVK